MHKVAILIDGGFFIKRLNKIYPNGKVILDKEYTLNNPNDFINVLESVVDVHLELMNRIVCAKNSYSLLQRIYYYDAMPFQKRIHFPVSKKTIDFGGTSEALFRKELFELLKATPNLALRLGELREGEGWVLKQKKQEEILKSIKNKIDFALDNLSDDDFYYPLRQKAVDMRIGIDIATLALKKQVDTIILFSGDGDFIPAAKLARAEGIKFILDIMGQHISNDLVEHVDVITSSFTNNQPNSLLNKKEWFVR